jgi:glycosyltransferase involved in cell wall biosynthesis
MSGRAPAVSVVIPCYDQGRFLAEAIASAVDQSEPAAEVVVVDDGSTDDTGDVARAAGVRCLRQQNRGLAAARNTGWRAARGDFIVFLDADDRLRPEALRAGLECLARYPAAAFVSGHYEEIDEGGRVLPTWRELRRADDRTFTSGPFQLVQPDGRLGPQTPRPARTSDHYTAMLRRNYIGMHGAVMYRRSVLEETGGFDPALRRLEDYELYLRVARRYPVACHDAVAAQYRRHPGGMSRRSLPMLTTALRVLRRQRPHLRSREEEQAYREGLRFWREFYGRQLISDLRAHAPPGRRPRPSPTTADAAR